MYSDLILIGLLFLVVINLLSFLAFSWDKESAKFGRPRVPEGTLLALALFGGSIGSIAGQHFLRHKTRKQPFKSLLYGIVAFQVIVAALAFVPEL